MQQIKIILLGVLAIFIAGCTSTINLKFHATRINPNLRQQSLPVQIKVYQLRNKDSFKAANFQQLWQQDQAILGNDLLQQKSIIVNPYSADKLSIKLLPDCNYLGFVAVFRHPEISRWKAIYAIPNDIPVVALNVIIRLHGNSILVEK